MPKASSLAKAMLSQCFMPLLCTNTVSAAKGGKGWALMCSTIRSRKPSMRLLCNTMNPLGCAL
jgi:hypothetical protein